MRPGCRLAEFLQNQPPEVIELRAKLMARSASLRRRGAEELETWGGEVARDLAGREGVELAPRHQLVARVALQAMVVAGTTWGDEGGGSYTERLAEMFDELETAVLELRTESSR